MKTDKEIIYMLRATADAQTISRTTPDAQNTRREYKQCAPNGPLNIAPLMRDEQNDRLSQGCWDKQQKLHIFKKQEQWDI